MDKSALPEKKSKINLFLILILIIGCLITFLVPFLFTRHWTSVSFKDTGPIGDTIGGTTAPFMSLLASILVYLALRAQIKANEIITKQFEEQKLADLERKKIQLLSQRIDLLRNELNDFTFTENDKGSDGHLVHKVYKGANALEKFIGTISDLGEGRNGEDIYELVPKTSELLTLLQIARNLIIQVESDKIPIDDREDFISNIAYLFHAKIRPFFYARRRFWPENIEICEKCGKKHGGFPTLIITLFFELNAKLTSTPSNLNVIMSP